MADRQDRRARPTARVVEQPADVERYDAFFGEVDYEVPVPSQLGLINMQDEVVVWIALRARVAAAGRAWVRTERTWASNGPRYRAAYEAILGPLG